MGRINKCEGVEALLTQAVVDRLGVVVVSVLADLVQMLQVRVCVELGHVLDGGHARFDDAAENERRQKKWDL